MPQIHRTLVAATLVGALMQPALASCPAEQAMTDAAQKGAQAEAEIHQQETEASTRQTPSIGNCMERFSDIDVSSMFQMGSSMANGVAGKMVNNVMKGAVNSVASRICGAVDSVSRKIGAQLVLPGGIGIKPLANGQIFSVPSIDFDKLGTSILNTGINRVGAKLDEKIGLPGSGIGNTVIDGVRKEVMAEPTPANGQRIIADSAVEPIAKPAPTPAPAPAAPEGGLWSKIKGIFQ